MSKIYIYMCLLDYQHTNTYSCMIGKCVRYIVSIIYKGSIVHPRYCYENCPVSNEVETGKFS